MSIVTLQQNAVSQLAAQADAVGGLAQDTGAFAAAVAAFESNDPDAFGWVLQRLEMGPQCELVCEWLRVKLWENMAYPMCMKGRWNRRLANVVDRHGRVAVSEPLEGRDVRLQPRQ
jgi:hypothetical protein